MNKKIFHYAIIILAIVLTYNIIPKFITTIKIARAERTYQREMKHVSKQKQRRAKLEGKQDKFHKNANEAREKIKEAKEIIDNKQEIYNAVNAEYIEGVWYTTEKEHLLKNTEKLNINIEYAYHLYRQCEATAIDISHCYKYGLGVANAESGLYKKTSKNNGYGMMYKGKLKSYYSIEESIDDWVMRYNKYRYKNEVPSQWLSRSRYCTSGCYHWVKNVQWVIDILNNK